MPAVEVSHISKSFGKHRAVENVSFSIDEGEFFGLLGPNGAGKTTIIRMILDIFRPDRGEVLLWGKPLTEAGKDRIGYLPEDRGIYQNVPLERCLVYLSMLKGLNKAEARRRVLGYLEQFGLSEYRKKNVKELSKGMQQKAQLIIALVHHPKLIIIDEPFSGLDPINTQMVKELLREENRIGATVIMSTHQLNQVEEMCDRLVLIDQSHVVLYGKLKEIRRQFDTRSLFVQSTAPLPPDLHGVARTEPCNGAFRLHLLPDAEPQAVLGELVQRGVSLEKFEIAYPSLDEIFIQVVTRQNAGQAEASQITQTVSKVRAVGNA